MRYRVGDKVRYVGYAYTFADHNDPPIDSEHGEVVRVVENSLSNYPYDVVFIGDTVPWVCAEDELEPDLSIQNVGKYEDVPSR